MPDIKLYNADCLVEMKNIPDNYIDLTVTSPPYDNLRTYNDTLESFSKDYIEITIGAWFSFTISLIF